MSYLTITSAQDADRELAAIRASAKSTQDWFAKQSGDPMELFRNLKFEAVGSHPIDGRALNVIEQTNQLWTFAVALLATKQLIKLHPEVSEFRLAPGASACLDLDIMSAEPGLIGAETFAAVKPDNNGKLEKDLRKLEGRMELHRYVFFMCPLFRGSQRLFQYERDDMQVWSVDLC